jgi:hypothetical protein
VTDEASQERYIQAAIRHGQATVQSDPDTANAQYDVIMEALNAMRISPQGEHAALVSILDHRDASVRCWAATHLLKIDPDKALPELHRLSALPELIGFDAEMVIKQWNKGRLP